MSPDLPQAPHRLTRNTVFLGLGIAAGTLLSMATALAADLPPIHIQGRLIYLSGGSGRGEARAMRLAERDYPLALEFFHRRPDGRRAPLSGDAVIIRDHAGRTVLQAHSDGPYLLAKLPPGRYTVFAEDRGRPQQKAVDLLAHRHQQVVFAW
jgi:hypothetical protein